MLSCTLCGKKASASEFKDPDETLLPHLQNHNNPGSRDVKLNQTQGSTLYTAVDMFCGVWLFIEDYRRAENVSKCVILKKKKKHTETESRNFLFLLLPEDTHTHTHTHVRPRFLPFITGFSEKALIPKSSPKSQWPRELSCTARKVFIFHFPIFHTGLEKLVPRQTSSKHQTPNTKCSASTYIQAPCPQPSPPSTCSCWGWGLLWKQTNIPSPSSGAPLLPGNRGTVPAKGSLLWTSLMPLAFLNREY